MAFQTVFKRYELKYLLTHEQKQHILGKNPLRAALLGAVPSGADRVGNKVLDLHFGHK